MFSVSSYALQKLHHIAPSPEAADWPRGGGVHHTVGLRGYPIAHYLYHLVTIIDGISYNLNILKHY